MRPPESWKPIPGFQDYAVSTHGRVKRIADSVSWKAGHLLSPANVLGYRCVTLRTGGISRMLKVHRLVLTAFVRYPNPGEEANHLDGHKEHNDLENLCWVTKSENMRHAIRHGLYAPPSGDCHWSRKYPHRVARGERNGMVLHPERVSRGETHPFAKLTALQVRHILSANYQRIGSQRAMAKKFNVSPSTICDIVNRKKWRHLR